VTSHVNHQHRLSYTTDVNSDRFPI